MIQELEGITAMRLLPYPQRKMERPFPSNVRKGGGSCKPSSRQAQDSKNKKQTQRGETEKWSPNMTVHTEQLHAPQIKAGNPSNPEFGPKVGGCERSIVRAPSANHKLHKPKAAVNVQGSQKSRPGAKRIYPNQCGEFKWRPIFMIGTLPYYP